VLVPDTQPPPGHKWQMDAAVGLALFTTCFCSQNTAQLMTASMTPV
jgi:hypothetical protein